MQSTPSSARRLRSAFTGVLVAVISVLFVTPVAAQTYTNVYGWGANNEGQLGNGSSTVSYLVPAIAELYGKTPVQVAVGPGHSLALDADGTIYAWGDNFAGQLGNNSTTDSKVPVIVNTDDGVSALHGKSVVAVAAGLNVSYALTSDGLVFAWGANESWGQLGTGAGSGATTSVPVAVDTSGVLSGKTITKIAAGHRHVLALDADGKVYAWGWNAHFGNSAAGQLGNNSSATSSNVPVAVDTSGVLSGKVITDIAAGGLHSVACASDGTVYSWGLNSTDGQLGNNSSTDSKVPVAVVMDGALSGKTVVAVAAGYVHSMALTSDGLVYAWGANYGGRLGDGSTTQSKVPVAVTTSGALSGKVVTKIAAGAYHSMALTSDHAAYTWGTNSNGALGHNTETAAAVPTAVDVTTGLSALAGVDVENIASGSIATVSLAIGTTSEVSTPGMPIDVSAAVSGEDIEVIFSAPPSTGGAAITGYTVTVVETGATFNGASSPITVTGLNAGIDYSFTVTAANSLGTGVASSVVTAAIPLGYTFTTFAGTTVGYADGTGTDAQFMWPQKLAVDSSGNIFVADTDNHRIRKITSDGEVTTVAGSGETGAADGNGTEAEFDSPLGIAVGSDGTLYVADTNNHLIRKITSDGEVSTFAGDGNDYTQDGSGTNASFSSPAGIVVDSNGTVYVSELDGAIRKITSGGWVTTLARGWAEGDFSDESNDPFPYFNTPSGLALDAAGNVYVADSGNHAIRKVTSEGVVTTIAGHLESGLRDGTGAAARFNYPSGIAVDTDGTIFVTERDNCTIRKITSDGVVTTIGGNGQIGVNDGTGVDAGFFSPAGIAVGPDGVLYVADSTNNRIKRGVQAPDVITAGIAVTTGAGGSAVTVDGRLVVAGSAAIEDATVRVDNFVSGDVLSFDNSALPDGVSGSWNGTTGILTFTGTARSVEWQELLRTVTFATSASDATTRVITFGLGTDFSITATASVEIPLEIVSVTAPADGTYVEDEALNFTVSFNAVVTVTGTPSIDLTIGSTTREATYVDGTGTSSITFRYTVVSGDEDSDGITVASPIELNGGSIKDADDNDAGLAFTAPDTSEVLVDAEVPEVLAIVRHDPGDPIMRADAVVFEVTFSEAVTGVDAGWFTLTPVNGGTTVATVASVTGGPSVFEVTVDIEGGAGDFRLDLTQAVLAPNTTPIDFATGLSGPLGLVFDDAGNLYVANTNSGVISRVTPEGVVSSFATGFSGPRGLAFDTDGNLYVANFSNSTISRVTPGGVVSSFASGFSNPHGLAFDDTGNLYVASYNANRVYQVTPDGGTTTTFAINFGRPGGLVFDEEGNLYVARSRDHIVNRVTPGGTSTPVATDLSTPFDVAFDRAGNLYIANFDDGTVRRMTSDGTVSLFSSDVTQPSALAFDDDGNLYVASLNGGTVEKFNLPTIDDLAGNALTNLPFTSGETYTYDPNDVPTVANAIADQNAAEDSAFSFQFAANTFADADAGDTLTYTAQLAGGGALPSWLSFNAATRTFSGTPLNAHVGTISIDVIANDGNGGTVTDTFNITVANTNDAPTVANAIPDQSATEDSPFSFQFASNTFADVDLGDTLTYSTQLTGGGALPSWLSFNAVTRTFSGTPLNAHVGTISIDVIANDGNGGTVTDTFNLTVVNTNDAPTVANAIPDQNATEDSPFSFQFASNTFADVDLGDTLTYSTQLTGGGALPSWLSFNAVTRTFSGTPLNAHVGTISIDVIANDGNGGTATDTFNLTVVNTNDAPTVANAIPDQIATEDSAFSFQFASNTFADVDMGDTLTYTALLNGGGALPSWLAFNAATRTFSGTPADGDVGTVSIDVIADDGNGGTVTDTFDVVVANTNDVPTDISLSQSTVAQSAGANATVGTLTTTDVDTGDTHTYTLVAGTGDTDNASFNLSGSTLRANDASALAAGSYSIRILTEDGHGGTYAETFVITVVDDIAPEIISILRKTPGTQVVTDDSVVYEVTFSEDVTDVTTDAFTVAATNGGTTAGTVASIAGGPSVYEVTLQLTSGAGDFLLDVVPEIATGSNFASGFVSPTYMAFDQAGELYVVNGNSNYVSRVAPDGTVSVFAAGFGAPNDIAFGPDGNLYVTNWSGNSISKVTPGGVISEFVGGLSQPWGLAFDAAGDLYVGNYGDNTISKVTPGGVVSTFANGFNGPLGMAFDEDGVLYVANYFGGTISKVTSDGTVNEFVSDLNYPTDLVIDVTGRLYVVQAGLDVVNEVADDGSLTVYAAGFTNSIGLAFDVAGDLYVSDYDANTVVRVPPAGIMDLSGNLVPGLPYTSAEVYTYDPNDAPTVANAIPDQDATEDSAFSFQFAANTFTDADAADTLTFTAQLNGGGALPPWLNFSAATRTFSGTPTNDDVGSFTIDVTADDGRGGTGTDTFTITVAAVNDAPTIANLDGDSVTYTEGGSSALLDGGAMAAVADEELDQADDWHGATITVVRNGGPSTEDDFGFLDGSGVSLSGGDILKSGASIATFTQTNGQLVIAFTNANGQTPTAFNANYIVRNITYRNLSDAPPASVVLNVTVSDGALSSSIAAVTVNITATNDSPTDLTISSTSVNQSGGANAVVGVFSTTDADDDTFTYTLVSGSGDSDNAWFNISGTSLRANDATTLAAGSYLVRVRTTDAGAAYHEKEFTLTVVDDVAPDAPAPPDLVTASDSGISNTDNLTNDNTPTFTGTAEVGSTVRLYADGSTLIGTATATDGTWTITSSALADGSHATFATATDLANNTGPSSSTLEIVVDTTPPSAPSTPDMDAGSDSGTSPSDNITNITTPVITGTADAGNVIELFDGITLVGSTISTGGLWDITPVLVEGVHSLTAVATDDAGNGSPASSALSITIDTTAPLITSPANASATYRTAFSGYTITASGNPVTFGASDLPAGLSVDTATGAITGIPSISGAFTVSLSVSDEAGNTGSADLSLTVDSIVLAVADVTAANKIFDGTMTATLDTSNATLVGVADDDDVTLDVSGAAAAFADANVGTDKTVTVSGLTLAGADAVNYTLTQPTATADITAAGLTVSGVTASNKIYDGTTTAALNLGSAALVGVLGNDAVTLDTAEAAGVFASADVGTNKIVTVTGLALTGADASNYTLTQPTTTADITKAALTVNGVTAANKTYDATTAATLDMSIATLVGVISGDVVTLNTTGASGVFADAEAGEGKTVTITGLALEGADAGNYTLTQPTTTAEISAGSASIAIGDLAQTYDGTAKAVTVTTTPEGLTVAVTYDGSSTAPTNAGSYAVAATITDPNFEGTASATLVIAKAGQTIAFNPVPGMTFGEVPFTVSASASSSLPVSFSIVSGPATISENTITISGAGEVIVRASQAGNENYHAAPDVDQSFTVGKANQAITFDAVAGVTYGATAFIVNATADSLLPVSFSIVSGPATIDGNTVTITGVGTVVVRASQAGDEDYNPAPDVDQSFTVGKANQAITFTALNDGTYGDTPQPLAATASSGFPVTFTVLNGPATIVEGGLLYTGAGTVLVRAAQPGSDEYNPAPNVDHTITVAPKELVVTATTVSRSYGDANPALDLTYEGFADGDSASDLDSAPVASTTATETSDVGSYPITVAGGTDNNYTFSYVAGSLTITPRAQSITFPAVADRVFSDPAFLLGATASSELPVSYTVVSGPATIVEGTASVTGVGVVTIRATQSGDHNHAAATPVERSFSVSPASATVALSDLTHGYDGTAKSATVTTSPSGLAVNVTYDGNGAAPTNAGSYAVVATITDENYTGSASGTLTIAPAGQVITFGPLSDRTFGDEPVSLVATASSGLPVAFSVVDGPAALSGSTLTLTGAGIVTVRATQVGNGNFAAALPVDRSFSVGKASASITLGALAATYDGTPKAATATTSPAGLTVNVTYDGSATVPTNAGSYAVVATIDDASYSGSTSGTLVIAKATQSITFAAIGPVTVNEPVALSASASSGLEVTFAVVSGPATISGSTLTLVAAGDVTIRVSQAGDVNHEPASVDQEIAAGSVTKQSQVITFPEPADRRVDAPPFSLTATASSGLPVSYTVISGPATVAGDLLTLTGVPGTVIITATQAGDDRYAAAADVSRTIEVTSESALTYFGDVYPTNGAEARAASVMAAAVASVGDFAAHLQPDGRSGTIIGYLPDLGEGFVVSISPDATGTFVATTNAMVRETSVPAGMAAAVAMRTFRGSIQGGILAGHIDELDLDFTGVLSALDGPAETMVGFYTSASLDTTTGVIYTIVGASGEVYVLVVTPDYVGGTTGAIEAASGTFELTSDDGATITGAVDAPGATVGGRVTLPSGEGPAYAGVRTDAARTDRLINLSSRARVGSGEHVLIAGFVIGGQENKPVLIRAVGPGLTEWGIGAPLANPRLRLYRNGDMFLENDDWGAAENTAELLAAIETTGAFELEQLSRDAALLVSLPPGVYTAMVDDTSGSGVALAEIYDASKNPENEYQRLVNISTRGYVGPGEDTLIGGFIVTGNAPKRVLIRGVGPGLEPHGVTGVLADPRLVLFDRQGEVVNQNDNWGGGANSAADLVAAATATGAFALEADSADAALLITLVPGSYTVHVQSVDGSTGVALVEIYEAPAP